MFLFLLFVSIFLVFVYGFDSGNIGFALEFRPEKMIIAHC